MKQKGLGLILIGAALLAAALPLRPAENYRVVNKPENFYYGHISYVEPTEGGRDPMIMREGATRPEPAVLNVPIGPGDVVRTSSDRRCEIQFDTGTIVRLDYETEVKVETILARSLSSEQELSNLALRSGRVYVMYKQHSRRETFQFLTPNTAVKLRHSSVSIIAAPADGSTEVQVSLGRAAVLYGADEKSLGDQEVRKGERFIVQKDHQSQLASFIGGTDFELWNRDINARFVDLHKGLTPLPKPLQKLSPAVFYFAQKYGSGFGEWLWDDYLGYIWRPFIDRHLYPWGWQPYFYGRWAYVGGQMFWVPDEPWGWVPYHLGIWHWDKKRGWCWIPGSLFAPAWVDWAFYFGYAAWRPWSLYDWMGYGTSGFTYEGDAWLFRGPLPLTAISKDQLKKPAPAPFPVPSELRGVLKTVKTAYLKQDPRIIDSLKDTPRHLVLVPKSDLNARRIQDRATSWEKLPKLDGIPPAATGPGAFRRFDDPGGEAARVFRGVEAPPGLPRRSGIPEARPAELRPSVDTAEPVRQAGPAPASREAAPVPFRDWNPDLKIARLLGVRIEYSSVRNEVLCPELKLSSRDRSREPGFDAGPRLTSSGVMGASSGMEASGSSGQSSSGSVSRGSQGSSGASEKEADKGGESGRIKN